MIETIDDAGTVRGALASMAARLRTESPAPDAQVALAHALARPRTWLAAHPEAALTAAQLEAAQTMAARLEDGEPLPYVIGHWEFYGLDFELGPEVLIPRPETELLVEHAIAFLRSSPGRHAVADVGTGSGVIAVSIAVSCPQARVLATDVSRTALEIASANALKHAVDKRITFAECDILPQSAGQRVDLICANLPYLPTEKLRELELLRREPSLALDGGPDGLDPIRRMLSRAPEWLNPGGLVLAEIEASQGLEAAAAARSVFPDARSAVVPDLAGRDRLLEIRA